jgi:hypothetical protein
VKAGDCYWAATGVDGDGNVVGHLFFVLLDADEDNGKTVVVPCCTAREHFYDDSCVLGPEDHAFVRRVSYADYYLADVIAVRHIDELIGQGMARMRASARPDVLLRLQQGLIASEHVRGRVKDWFLARYSVE